MNPLEKVVEKNLMDLEFKDMPAEPVETADNNGGYNHGPHPPAVDAALAWVQTLDLEHCHWMIANVKTAAIFMPMDKYTEVPTKWQKYVCVVYPKVTGGVKVYIARKEKAREMWQGFITKNPDAKKVAAIGIHSTGGLTENATSWDVPVSTAWYSMITSAIRKRVEEFASTPPMVSRPDHRFRP